MIINLCINFVVQLNSLHIFFDISLQNSEQRKEILNIILEKEKVDQLTWF